MRYAADFETTTTAPASVWAWALCLIGDDKIRYGTDIDSFMAECLKLQNPTIYFHNAKFDGSFIFYWLLTHGYELTDKYQEAGETESGYKKVAKPKANTFRALITGKCEVYSIEIYMQKGKNVHKVTIWDSIKIFRMSLEQVAECFDLPIRKGKIDYKRHDTPCEVTPDEWDYLFKDVAILSQALLRALKAGFDRMTIGSCALNDYKKLIGERRFNYLFPVLELDEDAEIRKAFKGAFVFLNPEFKNKEIGRGIDLDTNGLYSYILATKILPYGEPLKFTGKYQANEQYPLWIQSFRCSFKLKPGKLPTIQQRFDPAFMRTEYLESSYSEITDSYELVDLCMTNIDMILFFEHYEVSDIQWIGGYMFKADSKLFTDWISKWDFVKTNAAQDNNPALRFLAKLIVNNIYGKFAQNPNITNRYPALDHEGRVSFYPVMVPKLDDEGQPVIGPNGEPELTDRLTIEPVYVPVGVFITAYGRHHTIRAAQLMYDKHRFIYSDTDSLHLLHGEIPDDLPVSRFEIGKWKIEAEFYKARYLCPKRYILAQPMTRLKDLRAPKVPALRLARFASLPVARQSGRKYRRENLKIVCASMPDACRGQVTFDNFKYGKRYSGRLEPVAVPGGTIFRETAFVLNDPNRNKTKRG